MPYMTTFKDTGYCVITRESEAQSFAGELIWQQISFTCLCNKEKDTFEFFDVASRKIV